MLTGTHRGANIEAFAASCNQPKDGLPGIESLAATTVATRFNLTMLPTRLICHMAGMGSGK